jgi:hypothetical protein
VLNGSLKECFNYLDQKYGTEQEENLGGSKEQLSKIGEQEE